MSTTMQFIPEWMRTKNQPQARSQAPPSPPPTSSLPSSTSLSTYSALVSETPPITPDRLDETYPFRYSKEELLNIYQGNGWKGELGLEVERWEGVVREVAAEPITLREMTEVEKKLFAGSLNSEIRRRPSQSTDYLFPLNTSGLERPRMVHSASASSSTSSRERFGVMKRRDSAGGSADLPSNSIPRKPSLSVLQVPALHSPREVASPRTRHTSNFDGILNNGESWIARRRVLEASTKGPDLLRDGQAEEQLPVGRGIREEDEDIAGSQLKIDDVPPRVSSPPNVFSTSSSGQDMVTASKDNHDSSSVACHLDQPEVETPLVLPDLAAVEWSYKDPTGQIQGPFPADLMQKWYNEGYFTPDLPMKRTRIDTQWTTMQELVKHTTNGNVFFLPLRPVGPPGLDGSSSLHHYSTTEYVHTEPFQPAPVRSLRTSALETYLTGGSMASDSPSSSSLGASHLGNSSPDPSVFSGRMTDSGLPEHPSAFASSRLSEHDFVHDLSGTLQGPPFGNFSSDLDMKWQSFNHPVAEDPWNPSSGFQSSPFNTSGTNPNSPHLRQQVGFIHEAGTRSYGFSSATSHIPDYSSQQSRAVTLGSPVGNDFDLLVEYPHIQQSAHTFGLRALDPLRSQKPHLSINNEVSTESWQVVPPAVVPSEGVGNLAHTIMSQPNEYTNGEAVHDVTMEGDPISSGGVLQNGKEQDLIKALDQKVVHELDSRTGPAAIIVENSHPPTVLEAPKSNKNPTLQQVPSSDPSAPTPPRSVWAKDDDNRKKRANPSISLRAIQEAESKKLESIKAAEREKEKARAIPSSSETKEDLQPFTASWGLPISQAGGRHSGISSLPPPSAPTVATSAPPVWTSPLKTTVVKKSMKEIQEEEKRKKQTTRDTPAQVQRRAYAETTTKTPPTLSSNNNPWTIVGPNGRPTAPATSGRPATSTASSTPASSGITRTSVPSTQKPSPNSTSKTRPTIKHDEISDSPSHEFLKWLGDSLKGLNHSVNVEEFMAILLSFPLDADSSTMEIISDTIYANSTTLDGRRFAADFVAKRKADAAAQSISASDGPAKPVSIADVVKAVPKPAQPEWGFKVVNKKKKGGRS